MAEWATTFVSTAPEEITEAFASTVEAAVDTEVKEEQIKEHLLKDQNVVEAKLTVDQARIVSASFKGLAETMRGEMLTMLRKELGLGAKEAAKKEEEEGGGAYTEVPKGGCKAGAGQASTGPRRRADVNTIVNDLPDRTGAAKRAGDDIDDQQPRKQQDISAVIGEKAAAVAGTAAAAAAAEGGAADAKKEE